MFDQIKTYGLKPTTLCGVKVYLGPPSLADQADAAACEPGAGQVARIIASLVRDERGNRPLSPDDAQAIPATEAMRLVVEAQALGLLPGAAPKG